MSGPNTIRTAIKTRMDSVPGVGLVHLYARYARRSAELAAFYQDGANGPIRGWHIRRGARRQRSPANGRRVVTTRWEIEGYRSLEDDDASEQEFDELIEAQVLAFDADDKLGGAVDTCRVNEQAGLQLEANEYVLFGGVLCHRARLSLITRHYN